MDHWIGPLQSWKKFVALPSKWFQNLVVQVVRVTWPLNSKLSI